MIGPGPEKTPVAARVAARAFAHSAHSARAAQAERELRVLHLEDAELDHELALAHLRRSGLRLVSQRVESREEFAAALGGLWDVILSDYNLPGFTGVDALHMVRQAGITVPFILVSGEIGEETAVAAMRSGANDYVLKHNLARLAPAMEHAIQASETQLARQLADQALQASRQRLSELAQHLQTRVEMERAAIAREIHDDVGGSLTALKFELDWIRRHSTSPEITQRAVSALETVSLAIEASQRVMHNLRPAILEQGLVPALQWLASRFSKRTGIECGFSTSHELPVLPGGVPLVAYRTAQEALTNVSKHAQARRVNIELALGAGVLSLEVSDDGRGLSSADLAKAQSFGIRGLHERASTVAGWIDLSSTPAGTTLTLSVPLAAPAALATTPNNDDHDPSTWGSLE